MTALAAANTHPEGARYTGPHDLRASIDTPACDPNEDLYVSSEPKYWFTTTFTYGFENGTDDIAGEGEKQAIRDAFAIWTSAAPLTFTELVGADGADLRFRWAPIDGRYLGNGANGTLGRASRHYPLGEGEYTRITFDSAETWTLDERPAFDGITFQPMDLVTVAAHEIGHALGLGKHTSNERDLMHCYGGFVSGSHRYLAPTDIDRVQKLFGRNARGFVNVRAALTDPNGQRITYPIIEGGPDQPDRRERPITVKLLQGSSEMFSKTTPAGWDGGGYWAKVELSTAIQPGPYRVRIKLDHTLLSESWLYVYPGAENSIVSTVPVYPGDVTGDEKVNPSDFFALMGCYSDLQPPRACDVPSKAKEAADVNGDGSVNQYDYNLYLRVLRSRGTAGARASAGVADGDLDPGFGAGGMVLTNFASGAGGSDVVIQPDGRIVAVGFAAAATGPSAPHNFAIARYLSNGALDPSFDGDGMATVGFGFSADAVAVALGPDGKIIVVGTVTVGGGSYFALARLLPNGAPDPALDVDGKISFSLGASSQASALALQADGRIMVAGKATIDGVSKGVVARVLSDGSPDTSFNGNGRLFTDFSAGSAEVNAIVIQRDDKIVIAGSANVEADGKFALSRLLINGSADSSFAGGSGVTTDVFGGTGGFDSGQALVLQPDGRMVVAGQGQDDAGNSFFAAVRYTSDGALDSSFSGDGIATADVGLNESVFATALQPDGRIVLAGGDTIGGGDDEFFLARFLPNGVLDTSFSGDGRISTDFGRALDVALGVAIEPNGGIIAAGASADDSSSLAVARYGSSDRGTIVIGDAAVAEGDAGTKQLIFTIERSGYTAATACVDWSTADGSGIAGTDYVAVPTTNVCLAPGDITKSLSVTVNGDSAIEPDETFTVNLASATSADLGDASATGTIVNDDSSIVIDDVAVIEGNVGPTAATFTVTRAGVATGTSLITWATANNSAGAGTDYVAVPAATLTFDPGDTVKTVTVTVNGDLAGEADESFLVKLSNPVGTTLADSSGVGTIVNDDTSFAVNDVTVTEGNSGTTSAVFTVTRAGNTTGTSTVRWATGNGTATAGTDYSGVTDATLSFGPGETTKMVWVHVIGDTQGEANETFFLRLSAPAGATIIDDSGLGLITNDDTALSVNDVSVLEGDSGPTTATFTITRTGPNGSTSSVAWSTANYSAGAGTDYVAVPPTPITFAPGETTKSVSVTVNGDMVGEPTESFYVKLSNATGATILDGSGFGVITNDDTSVAVNDVTLSEGNSGTRSASFTITRAGSLGGTSTVKWATAANSATPGSDYVEVAPTTLTFVPNETRKTLTVTVNGDTQGEANETFFVRLSDPVGTKLADATGLGLITNDDTALAVNDVTVTEGSSGTTVATFTITRTGPTTGTSSVTWATGDNSAKAGTDYVAVAPTTVTFGPGVTTKTVTVNVQGDTTVEPNESFFVKLSNPSGATILDGSGFGVITNDDNGA